MYQITINAQDNIYFYNEPFSLFLEKDPQIPKCQRNYIEERILHFYNKIIENETIPYIGLVHCASYNNNLYIVDGQHRFFAFKKAYENKKIDFSFQFIVKSCLNRQEIIEFFKSLNDNYNLHDIILDDFDKVFIIKDYINLKYKKHISNSEKPKYPNVNLDQLTKYLIDRFKESDDILKDIEQLNTDIYNLIKDNEQYAKQKQGLYLGYLFKKTEDEKKRKNIPQTVRYRLWDMYFKDTTTGFCAVCSVKIDTSNFHAGHIISSKNNGTDKIDNLIPVCSCCNLSMGTNNLNEFKEKYF